MAVSARHCQWSIGRTTTAQGESEAGEQQGDGGGLGDEDGGEGDEVDAADFQPEALAGEGSFVLCPAEAEDGWGSDAAQRRERVRLDRRQRQGGLRDDRPTIDEDHGVELQVLLLR